MNTTMNATPRIAVSKATQILSIFMGLGSKVLMGEAYSLLLIASGETQEGGGITITELASKSGVALSTASRTVDALTNDGKRSGGAGYALITSTRDPMDDRRKILRLTAKGRRTIETISHLL